ncbi:MAG: hypothetical protein CL920_04935 [Deltaproteobacteria bacterium]|nr:hypothetical protein [Deltaproteobacteria bacterium]
MQRQLRILQFVFIFLYITALGISGCGPTPCAIDEDCPEGFYCATESSSCQILDGACTPGQKETCYTGPFDTKESRPCHAGERECLPTKEWSTCRGQQLPSTETCNGKDDDCDGQVDDNCQIATFCEKHTSSSDVIITPTLSPGSPHKVTLKLTLKETSTWRWSEDKPLLTIHTSLWKTKDISFIKETPQQAAHWRIVLQHDAIWSSPLSLTFEGTLIAQTSESFYCPIKLTTEKWERPCPQEKENCDGLCISLQNDPNHCGGCGNVCSTGETCCGGKCVSLQTNQEHCGTCGHACNEKAFCQDGRCIECQTSSSCPQGSLCLNNQCVNCPGDARCGKTLWLESKQYVAFHNITEGPQGELFVAGVFNQSVTIGEKTYKEIRNGDIFLTKWDKDWKQLQWWRQIGGLGVEGSSIRQKERLRLKQMPDGTLLFVGQANSGGNGSTVHVFYERPDEVQLKHKFPLSGNITLFAKITQAGGLSWAKALAYDWAWSGSMAIAITKDDKIWSALWGKASDKGFMCGNKQLSKQPTSNEYANISEFGLLQYSTKGECQLGHIIEKAGFLKDVPASLLIDAQENILWLGHMPDNTKLGTYAPPKTSTESNPHSFLATLSQDGTIQKVLFLSTLPGIQYKHMTIDKDGTLYLTGQFQRSQTIGKQAVLSNGKQDIFVTKMKRDGTHLWTKTLGSVEQDDVHDIALSSKGVLCVLISNEDAVTYNKLTFPHRGKKDLLIPCWDTKGTFKSIDSIGGKEDDIGSQLYWSGYRLRIVGWSHSPTLQLGTQTYTPKSHENNYNRAGFVWTWTP